MNYAGSRFEEAHTVVEAFLLFADVAAAVEVPAGQRVQDVRGLVSGQPLPFEVQDGEAVFTVPQIAEYEAVVVSLRSA